MTWTIETEESDIARRLTGAINGRYQVCHPVHGFIDAADTLGEAFRIGDAYELRKMPDGTLFCGSPYQVDVYDRMARNGQPRVWRRQRKDATHCWERGDKMSMDGRWKCVEKRGVKRVGDDMTSRLWS